MSYLVEDIHDIEGNIWSITNIIKIDGVTFINLADVHNLIRRTVNVRDIYFGHTNVSNMYVNNISGNKYYIDWIYSHNTKNIGVLCAVGHIRTIDRRLAFVGSLDNRKIHINDIYFRVPDGVHYKLYKYPLLDIVWSDIKAHCMIIMTIAIIADIQKFILQIYLKLINTTLQPSFKLF